MRLFAIWIKHALNVSVQAAHTLTGIGGHGAAFNTIRSNRQRQFNSPQSRNKIVKSRLAGYGTRQTAFSGNSGSLLGAWPFGSGVLLRSAARAVRHSSKTLMGIGETFPINQSSTAAWSSHPSASFK
jgi:hypothetical protein